MFKEVRFISTMSEFDQDITWLLQAPFMLLTGSFGEFNFKELIKEVNWKNFITQLAMVAILVAFYVYVSIKQKINPIFFLVSLCAVFSVLLFIVFGVNW